MKRHELSSPHSELCKGGRPTISSNHNRNQTPAISRHGTLKERCSTFSGALQKEQVLSPCHPFLDKLSLVRIVFCITSHMNILIFRGIFAFQSFLFLSSVSVSHKRLYRDFTENCPFSPNHLGTGRQHVPQSSQALLLSLI